MRTSNYLSVFLFQLSVLGHNILDILNFAWYAAVVLLDEVTLELGIESSVQLIVFIHADYSLTSPADNQHGRIWKVDVVDDRKRM